MKRLLINLHTFVLRCGSCGHWSSFEGSDTFDPSFGTRHGPNLAVKCFCGAVHLFDSRAKKGDELDLWRLKV